MKKNSDRFKKIKVILRLFEYARLYKFQLIMVFVVALLSTLLSLAPTYLMKPLTDRVFAPPVPTPYEDRMLTLHILIIVLVVIHGIQTSISSILEYWKSWLSEKMGVNLRNALYAHLQKLSLKFYNLERTGGLHSRVCHDTTSLQQFIVFDLVQLFIYLVMFVGIGTVLFYLQWQLAILLLVPMPLIIVISNTFGERLISTYRKLYQKMADMSSVVFSAIKGNIVVKTNVAEERELGKFGKANVDVSMEELHCARLNFFFLPSMGFIIFLSGVMVRWLGGWQVIRQELTLGEMMVFIGYMWQFYGPVKGVNTIYAKYQDTVAAAERVFEVLDSEPEIRNLPDAVALPGVQENIRFDNVAFTYDGRINVLEDVNLEVKLGEIVGVTGLSGGGKSTLMYLLARLYNPSKGSIFVDGHEVRDVKIESLRNQIGLVLQETLLFYGTVAENIAYGRLGASRIEIIFAAKAAGAHNFIMQLPDAYDTLLGEAGTGLSGGESQRISIARVLLKDPKIIVFDEATSSVDLETEAVILRTIEKLRKDRIIFIISHKLSMLRKTDKLVVLDNGKITELGTYESLGKAGGRFSRLLKEKKLEDYVKKRSRDIYVV